MITNVMRILRYKPGTDPAFGTQKTHKKGSLIQFILNSLSVQTYKITLWCSFQIVTVPDTRETLREHDIGLQMGNLMFFPIDYLCSLCDFASVPSGVCIFSFLQQELIFPKMLEGKSLPHTKQNERHFFFFFFVVCTPLPTCLQYPFGISWYLKQCLFLLSDHPQLARACLFPQRKLNEDCALGISSSLVKKILSYLAKLLIKIIFGEDLKFTLFKHEKYLIIVEYIIVEPK